MIFIVFPFSFFQLHDLLSFHQCLHLLWHSIMYKLLIKILLSPSFYGKCMIEWGISNLSLVKTGQKTGVLLGQVFGIPASFDACLFLLVPC